VSRSADRNDQDAYAIFCVTDFWQHLALGADGAGKAEARQAYNVALAASKIPTLQHYLFSTLPNASEISGGKHPVPHFDHKARIDDRIRAELPELARKTTFIWLGWYSANLASPGFMRFFELPQSGGKYVWMQPSRPDALLPTAGDVAVNLGVFALAALNHPDKSRGKYVFVCTDVLTFVQITKEWEKVTGIQAEYVPISAKGLERIWGPGGKEMALQMAFGEDCDDVSCLLDPASACANMIGRSGQVRRETRYARPKRLVSVRSSSLTSPAT
jgi:hypothetical protein